MEWAHLVTVRGNPAVRAARTKGAIPGCSSSAGWSLAVFRFPGLLCPRV